MTVAWRRQSARALAACARAPRGSAPAAALPCRASGLLVGPLSAEEAARDMPAERESWLDRYASEACLGDAATLGPWLGGLQL